MSPREILDLARREQFAEIASGDPHHQTPIVFCPSEPVSPDALALMEQAAGVRFPADIRDLLSRYAGFEIGGNEVSFTAINAWGYGFLLPTVAVLMGDGFGNSWAVEIDATSGQWEHVWYECHDPPVLMYQCATLSEFINSLLDMFRLDARRRDQSGVANVWQNCNQIWADRGSARRARELLESPDELLRAFAASLPPHAIIADLRQRITGSGVDWSSLKGGRTPLRRAGKELLFALEPN